MQNELLELLQIIDNEVVELEYGTMVVQLVVANGTVNMQSLKLVKTKRKRYK